MTPPRTADQQKDHDMLIEVLSGVRRIDETIERIEKQLDKYEQCREQDEQRIRALEQISSARNEQIRQLQDDHEKRFAALQAEKTAGDNWSRALTLVGTIVASIFGAAVK